MPKKKKKVTLELIDSRLSRMEKLLKKELSADKKILLEEEKEDDEIKKLEKLEKEIIKDVSPHPLTKITYHDITKGLVGAFFGVVGHFAFFYGDKLAANFSILRATGILFSSMLLLVAVLYFTGFRRVKEYHAYLPARFLVIYITALSVAALVLFLFGIAEFPINIATFYKELATVSVLAVMGAATADLIGGEA